MATLKQKKAFKLVESGRKIGEVMVKAGYSKNTAIAPTKLTKSKGWLELMEKYLPDKLLAEKHRELLEVPKKVRRYIKGDLESEYEELDSQAISKGLDMGYKLKGKYAPEKSLNVNIELNSTPQIKELTKKLNGIYRGTSVPSDGGIASTLDNKAPNKE
jgi:hypothetical protein